MIHRAIRSRKPVVRNSDLLTRILLPNSEEGCGICQEKLDINVVAINKCKHQFHMSCIYGWFQKERTCPYCKDQLVCHVGNQPNIPGSFFRVLESKRILAGYADTNSLVVRMFIPSGIQPSDGVLPGKVFNGISEQYFFPNTSMFSDIISMLKKAWDQRLIYTYNTNGVDLVVNGFIFERNWKRPMPHYPVLLNMCLQEVEIAPSS